MKYFLRKKGGVESQGPFSFQKIKNKVESENITKDYLVKDSTLETDWFEVSTLLEYKDKEKDLLEIYNRKNYKYEGEKEQELVQKNNISETNDSSPTPDFQFKTLLGYGKFISGFGWFLEITSIFLILLSVIIRGNTMLPLLSSGIIAIITGISFIVSGQLISCFISIEKNTRAIYELLREKQ